MTKPVVFVTIDTEEDDWGQYDCADPEVTNGARLPDFQALCDRYGAVPTYLANWPMIANDSARDVLRDLLAEGRCEIATHIHPWNTPPVTESVGPRNSMLCNLPGDLVAEKLHVPDTLGQRLLESS